MPTVLKWFTYPKPLRYCLTIIRGTFRRAIGAVPPIVGRGHARRLLAISVLRFRKCLE
jgi:hypothetical protein